MAIMLTDNEELLMHYGTPRHSGRYPWGSGEHPFQSLPGFYNYVKDLKNEGYSDDEIIDTLNSLSKAIDPDNYTEMSSRDYKSLYSASREKVLADNRAQALKLKEKGYSDSAIAEKMGISTSAAKNLVKDLDENKQFIISKAEESLKSQLETKKYLDVGAGTENYMEITRTKLDSALAALEAEGYELYNVDIKQVGGTGKYTTTKVLCPPGTTFKDVVEDYRNIETVAEWYDSDSKTMLGLKTPTSVDSSRVQVNYSETGGASKDGLIEIRRGVEDLTMGDAQYAQVRIQVDDDSYLKGMCVYSDNLPDGVDIRFNTSKSKASCPTDKDAMKSLKDDADNPFGAIIKKQIEYESADGETKLSAVNLVNEESDWGNWKKTVSAQMLSKQSPELAKKQLAIREDQLKAEFDDIMEYGVTAIKKECLLDFAETCDSSAVHMEAAAFPRQTSKVILPSDSLADNEIYCPTLNNGETVALIRYPHGGKFEIPILTVNNKNAEAKEMIGNADDAACINSSVAARLSGADFDGDTVLVIPNNNGQIKSSSPLAGLKDYDPKVSYPYREGQHVMVDAEKQREMGKVTNLIADMTIKGASDNEIARAVRHSMTVIDAVKHELDYETSYTDNNIAQLKEKYQGAANAGASTLITRSPSDQYVDSRTTRIDKETGEKYYITKKGAKVKSTKGAEVSNAYDLIDKDSAPTTMEIVYAEHSNALRSLANEARKIAVNLPTDTVNQSAKETYANEITSLKAKLNTSEKNAPLERQAQREANMVVRAKRSELAAQGKTMTKDDYKKVSQQAISAARERVGASKKNRQVNITQNEWEAIQSNALPASTVKKIFDNASKDQILEYISPKTDATAKLTDAKKARIKAMINAGCTQAEVADIIGVSTSTVSRVIKE